MAKAGSRKSEVGSQRSEVVAAALRRRWIGRNHVTRRQSGAATALLLVTGHSSPASSSFQRFSFPFTRVTN